MARGRFDEHFVGPGRDLHLGVGVGQRRSISVMALVGTIVMLSPDSMAADALGRHFHFGQPTAVGADADDLVVGEFEQHAAQGIAAAFVIGGEDRAADQFFQQAGPKARGISIR